MKVIWIVWIYSDVFERTDSLIELKLNWFSGMSIYWETAVKKGFILVPICNKFYCVFFQQILLSWTSFDFEDSSNCIFDYVEIFDGPDVNRRSLGKFCGSSLPPTLKSSRNEVFIKSVTDEYHSYGRFMLSYQQVGELWMQ